MASQITSQNDYTSKILNGIYKGSTIMLAQTPFVTSLNRVSVVSCFENSSMIVSIRDIYQGKVDQTSTRSTMHFFRGISGHLTKETARISFKATGLVMKSPMDQYFKERPFGKMKSDLLFAGALSLGEIMINPADTVRTMWQAGERLQDIPKGKTFSHLYKGAGANGVRQFGTWLGFPLSERVWSKQVKNLTSLNPSSFPGIVLKSLPQAYQITATVWLFERVKNELQYRPNLVQDTTLVSRYSYAVKHIKSSQGWGGFIRGFTPKVLSNYILVIGANYLLELGKKKKTG